MEDVNLLLGRNEAVVLFEWLARFNETGEAAFVEQAEQRVLRNMEAVLESRLLEPLNSDDKSVLAAAREAIRDSTG